MAQLGFDPSTVPEDERDFPLLPDGVYAAQMTDSELLDTKSGTGQMLKLTLEIIEGPCRNRKLWDNLNIFNANAQAQEIAQRTLRNICLAVGHVGVLNDSADLHFRPMRIRVGHDEAKGMYKAQNRIKGYEPLNGVAPQALPAQQRAVSIPAPQQQAAAQPAVAGAAPWRRAK